MAEVNCIACEDLKANTPELIVNGLDETMCASLKNNTGLSTKSGHDNCTDLNNLNDCLVGNMETEIDKYDVCDWREFMKAFIGNLWTTLKAIICAMCGIWGHIQAAVDKAECTYRALTNLTNILAQTTGGVAFVRYFRDLGAGDAVPYWENISSGFHPNPLEIYMDSSGASGGSQPADRDYVVMISNCTNFVGFNDIAGRVTYYSSGDTRSIESIREHQGQHPDFKNSLQTGAPSGVKNHIINFSWTTSGAVLLKKGEHIKVDFYAQQVNRGTDTQDNTPKVRLHQFVLTWIPVNVEEPLDPSDILIC